MKNLTENGRRYISIYLYTYTPQIYLALNLLIKINFISYNTTMEHPNKRAVIKL